VVTYKLTKTPPVVLTSDNYTYFKASFRSDISLFTRFVNTAFEVATIVSKECTAIPFVKVSGTAHYNMGYGLGFHVTGGVIGARKPVPFPEKFRIGGIPVSHGIEHEKFGTSVGGFPSGCDSYLAGTLDFSTLIFPEYALNAHFFLNGAISANRKSNSILDFAPSVSSVVSVGAGLTFTQGPVRVQANIQHPYHVSSGLSFSRFQFGISPI
jgi:outer membrane protein assembly factor BamA